VEELKTPASTTSAARSFVPRTEGAVISFRATPGLTAQWLQRVIDCHLARNAALGHTVGGLPKLEKEANLSLLSMAETVKMLVPLTRAGEEVLASALELPAAKANFTLGREPPQHLGVFGVGGQRLVGLVQRVLRAVLLAQLDQVAPEGLRDVAELDRLWTAV
jgi:hypothetical protein